ncbi:zinc metallochaperone AztD [Georgenia phoenicis]|uniref:zinc metallochaperone AztD n=1 Tax=unclassified Georgenia TaxID=2626815 RepID=UPI0039B0900C
MPITSRRALPALGLLATLALAACAPGGADDAHPSPAAETPANEPVEVATLDPRVVLTYDGGVMTVDTGTGEVLDDVPLSGFLRVNPAGDGRHVLVSTAEGFQAYDTGLLVEGHGDHHHYYASAPALTDTVLAADVPGHVVTHAGRTALFADGTGEVQVIDPAELADGTPQGETWTAPDPHHGVAVTLSDDTMLVSVGTEDGRTGAALVGPDGEELAAGSCPGLHGEAVAAGEAVVVGCEDGPLVLRDGAFHKVTVEDEYARSGNLAGSSESAVVLGDYKVDPEAELERPERVALIDTRTDSLRLVDLGASYTFRSLGRGLDGQALVLTTDGSLRVIDDETGEELRRVDVVGPWEEPLAWQEPRPALQAADGVAYVTEPAARELHAVDLATGVVVRTYELPHVPNELAVATGFPPASDEHDGEDGHAHD